MSSTVAASVLAGGAVIAVGTGARAAGRTLRSAPACPARRTPRPERARGRRTGAGDDSAVAAVLHLQASLSSGASMLLAFGSLATASQAWSGEAQRIVAEVHRGAALQEALDAWSDRSSDPAVALLADGLAIAATTGGSQLGALGSVAAALRERAELQREIRALASQARASAVVVVAAPLAFAVVVAGVDPRIRAFFLHSVAGPACIGLGVGLDLVGAAWMHRIVRRVA